MWTKDELDDEIKNSYQYVLDLRTRLDDSAKLASANASFNPQLSTKQVTDLNRLVSKFQDVFSDNPGRTDTITHEIHLTIDVPVHNKHRVLHHLHKYYEDEVNCMLKPGISKPSTSSLSHRLPYLPQPFYYLLTLPLSFLRRRPVSPHLEEKYWVPGAGIKALSVC